MKIIEQRGLDFSDVLIVPQWTHISSRENVDLEREFQFYHSPKTWNGVPIIIANMDGIGNLELAKKAAELKVITCLSKFENDKDVFDWHFKNIDDIDYIWYTVGINEHKRWDSITESYIKRGLKIPNLCVDIANGHNEDFAKSVAKYRDINHQSIILAGNVVTDSAAQRIIDVGKADIVKIGIGSGRNCVTRKVTGVGVPQLTAIISTSHSVHGMSSARKRMGLICSDGGCRSSGDIAKAFAANADFCMIGSMVAGVEEHVGNWKYKKIFDNGVLTGESKDIIDFYGSSSYEAQDKHNNRKDYRASEGILTTIKYKGLIQDILKEYMGGIRSACSYVGANCLKDLSKCSQFIKVNRVNDENI